MVKYITRRVREEGSVKIGVNYKFFLKTFPGSMGGSTDSEMSVIERPESGTTRQNTEITMTEEEN